MAEVASCLARPLRSPQVRVRAVRQCVCARALRSPQVRVGQQLDLRGVARSMSCSHSARSAVTSFWWGKVGGGVERGGGGGGVRGGESMRDWAVGGRGACSLGEHFGEALDAPLRPAVRVDEALCAAPSRAPTRTRPSLLCRLGALAVPSQGVRLRRNKGVTAGYHSLLLLLQEGRMKWDHVQEV